MKKFFVLFVVGLENLKNLKYHKSYVKHKIFLLFLVSTRLKMKKY